MDASETPGSRRGNTPAHDQQDTVAVAATDGHTLREEVVSREKEEFGGMKLGSAFFGWLTATGMAVILTALVAAGGAAVGLGVSGNVNQAAANASSNPQTVGIVGAIAIAVILFVAYYCGGYVAGRMARFSGAKQGIAVWLWALLIAVIVAAISYFAGNQYNVLGNLNSFPRIPLNEGDLTLIGVLTAVGAAVVSLLGAILGGTAGMRFHRKVDRVGLGR